MAPQNYRHEIEQVYAGGAPSEQDLKELASKNIRNILSLDAGAASNIKPYIKKYNMKQIVVPLKVSPLIDDNLKYIKRQIRNIISNHQPIYVHCSDGTNRTGLVIATYQILKGAASPEQAINSQKKWKYEQNLNADIKKSWDTFLHSLVQQPAQKTNETSEEAAETSTIKSDVALADDGLYNYDINALLKEIYRINDITPAFNTLPSFAPNADIPFQAEDPNIFDYLSDEEDDDKIEHVPQMGQYSNMAQTRGAGAVEGAGPLNIFQY